MGWSQARPLPPEWDCLTRSGRAGHVTGPSRAGRVSCPTRAGRPRTVAPVTTTRPNIVYRGVQDTFTGDIHSLGLTLSCKRTCHLRNSMTELTGPACQPEIGHPTYDVIGSAETAGNLHIGNPVTVPSSY